MEHANQPDLTSESAGALDNLLHSKSRIPVSYTHLDVYKRQGLGARLQVAKNNPQQAGRQFAAALKLYPDNRALLYGYSDHFLALKQADNAVSLVKEKQRLYPNDAYFYEVLAKAYTMQNKKLLAYQAQSEAYFRKYDLSRAIEQMELAAKANDGDFYQQSIVEARLKELRRMQGEEKKRS